MDPDVIPLATLGYWEDWYRSNILHREDDDRRGREVVGAESPSASTSGIAHVERFTQKDGGEEEGVEDDDDVFEWLSGTGAEGGAMWRRLMSLPRDSRVLELGCGVSRIAERMALDEGFNVHAIDFSPIPIDLMRARAEARKIPPERLRYDVADVLHLDATFSARSFDVVVDKGLMDVLLNAHDQNEWWRRSSRRKGPCGYDGAASVAAAAEALRQVSRVLRPGGVFLMLSYEPPKGRSAFLEADGLGWTFQAPPKEDEKGNFLYVMQKQVPGEKERGADQGDHAGRIIETYDPDDLD